MQNGNTDNQSGGFYEVATRTVDKKHRITLGKFIKGYTRIRLYKNDKDEILLKPLLEVPASETWLFQNEEALESVKKGLKDAADGNIERLNPDEL